MLSRTEIESRVRFIIAFNLSIDGSKINMQARLVEDLGADSLDVSQLCLDLENEFDIVIRDDKFERLRTIENIIDFIEWAKKLKTTTST